MCVCVVYMYVCILCMVISMYAYIILRTVENKGTIWPFGISQNFPVHIAEYCKLTDLLLFRFLYLQVLDFHITRLSNLCICRFAD